MKVNPGGLGQVKLSGIMTGSEREIIPWQDVLKLDRPTLTIANQHSLISAVLNVMIPTDTHCFLPGYYISLPLKPADSRLRESGREERVVIII